MSMSSTPSPAAPHSRRRDWSDLPRDALVSILRHLFPPPPPPPVSFTLSHFSAAVAAVAPSALVSRSWRAAARAAATDLSRSLPPLLWEGPPYYRSVQGESIFYSPVERRPYRKPMPAALSRLVSCIGFSHGYVIAKAESLTTAVALAVVCPFTGAAVRGFPPLPDQLLTSSPSIKAALSAPPASLGCVLTVFGPGTVFHARISDPMWATETAPATVGRPLSVAAVGRRIYALSSDWKLLAVEFTSSSLKMSVLETGGDLPPRSTVSLVDSGDGDLLAVQAIGCDSFFWLTGQFAVYRMDFAVGRWVRLRGLGSKTLFVDCYGHVFAYEPGWWGGKGNCVYFTSVQRKAVGVFNMEDGSVAYLPSNMKCYRATDMWILPGVCFF